MLARDVGDGPASVAAYEAAIARDPACRSAAQNRLMGLNYVLSGDDPVVCGAHAAWGEALAASVPRLPPLPRPPPGPARAAARSKRLTVAYVSPDLVTHSVSFFAEAPLAGHSAGAVRCIAYACAPAEDGRTAQLKAGAAAAGAAWVDASHLSEAALAARARADGVDVLVDLSGHTAGNRLAAFAARPAPVQVTWIGYPNSTGLREVDYRLTDGVADPVGTAQAHAERLARLPGCFLCYTPPTGSPPVAPLPALAAGGVVTFASFNALAKHSPGTLRLWARVLAAVPRSRLLMKARPFACASSCVRWRATLAAAGLPAERVDLLPLTPDVGSHLAAYGGVDVALDPFPYAGTTTTAEALHMGVPVLTRRGRCHAANVGVSLLTAVGLDAHWVAADDDAYVATAVRVAADLHGLAALRAGLRARLAASPLCDRATFVAGLEAEYRRMWHAWLDGEGDGNGGVAGEAGVGGGVEVEAAGSEGEGKTETAGGGAPAVATPAPAAA